MNQRTCVSPAFIAHVFALFGMEKGRPYVTPGRPSVPPLKRMKRMKRRIEEERSVQCPQCRMSVSGLSVKMFMFQMSNSKVKVAGLSVKMFICQYTCFVVSRRTLRYNEYDI